jgi:hypothetical protein
MAYIKHVWLENDNIASPVFKHIRYSGTGILIQAVARTVKQQAGIRKI